MTRRSANGFTLAEILAVIVICAILGSFAMGAYQDFRYAARTAAMDAIGTSMNQHMQAAITAYFVRGSGSSLVINGTTIPVHPPGSRSTYFAGNPQLPAGAPTGPGMYALLGCSATVPAATGSWQDLPCSTLPGYKVWVHNELIQVAPDKTPFPSCNLFYFPSTGYDPSPSWVTSVSDSPTEYYAQRVGYWVEYQKIVETWSWPGGSYTSYPCS